jgi:hypothetical protein
MPTWNTVAEALAEEYRLVRPEWSMKLPYVAHDPASPFASGPLKALYAETAKLQGDTIGPSSLSALCLSGGGIRSATFNLGVLQALARLGFLTGFDYLSTVSGGGYVGSWLQAWIHEKRSEPRLAGSPVSGTTRNFEPAAHAVAKELSTPNRDDPLAPEPKPVDRLREFSNYLTPRTGVLSGDTWAVVAIVVRNLLLNWLVILPVLAALVLVPQLVAVFVDERLRSAEGDGAALATAALVLALLSSATTQWLRAHRRGPAATSNERERRRQRWERSLSIAVTLGLFVSSALLFLACALTAHDPLRAMPLLAVKASGAPFAERLLAAAAWTVGVPVVGALASWGALFLRNRSRNNPPDHRRPEEDGNRDGAGNLGARVADLVALIGSGAAAAAALAWLTGSPLARLFAEPSVLGSALVSVFAFPALLVLYALARALFTGISSAAESLGWTRDGGDDADREWWARITGRVLAVAAVWVVGSALVLFGAVVLTGEAATRWGDPSGKWGLSGTGVLGALASAGAALLGRSEDTSSGRGSRAGSSPVKDLLLSVAAPLAIASIFVLLAAGTGAAAHAISGADATHAERMTVLAWMILALGLASFVAGFFVDVNRFSLHRMYRNRLVRAYLGASNRDRRPNPVSGFDPRDGEVRLASLRPAQDGEAMRLFPIVNVTLNLIRGEKLAWQERQSESFSMTPLHCGNFYEGYRRTEDYGSHHGGVSLGTAMAISGAAASPNMGYVSTPTLTFLLGLFNARLGMWLANPNESGKRVVSSAGPRHATVHLLRELLGATNRYSPYVNLSDGGHFDNLGLYEVVLRRCRLVVVSDAACDPGFGFGDLGNAIRKIRIDFGIPIEFERPGIAILPRATNGTPPVGPGLYCAVGTIGYDAVDGANAPKGKIIYLKPTLAPHGESRIPYDVLSYALGHVPFPHESTADQWFSEAQLESYRALGAHLVEALIPGGRATLPKNPMLEDLYWAAMRHVYGPDAEKGAPPGGEGAAQGAVAATPDSPEPRTDAAAASS